MPYPYVNWQPVLIEQIFEFISTY